MFGLSSKLINLSIQVAVLLLLGSVSTVVLAKTWKVDCTKNGKLQATIDGAASGDTIEISGICMENILATRDHPAGWYREPLVGQPGEVHSLAADTFRQRPSRQVDERHRARADEGVKRRPQPPGR